MNNMSIINISTEYIKLDSAMKLGGAALVGGEAKHYITDGLVSVNGETELRRGRKLYPGDRFSFDGKEYIIALGLENER